MDDKPSDKDARMERSRERRRRINQAFRDGDLKTCLKEIKAELEESSEESDLLKALPKVQGRYLTEVVTSLIENMKFDEADTELTFVLSIGEPTEEVTDTVNALRERIDSLRNVKSIPVSREDQNDAVREIDTESVSEDEAEEALWREAHAVLRQGEQAWAEGKKRQARVFVERLDTYPIDDHDFLLRKDGLMKLLDESEPHLSKPVQREASAGKWVVVLALILACVLIVVFLLDRFSKPEDSQTEPVLKTPRITDSARTEPDVGYIRISGIDSSAVVFDEDGGVIGRGKHVFPVLSGENVIRIRSEGYHDTTLSLAIARTETIDISVDLRKKPPPRGWVQFRSEPPGASVIMESGNVLGTTPLDSIIFEPGSFGVTMKKDGYVPITVKADVKESKLTVISGELPVWHDTGRFQLNARPWAYVFVNGDSLGPTPLTTKEMPTATSHTFLFRSADGRELTQRLRLDPARSSPTPVTVEFPEPGILAVATIDSVTKAPMWATISGNSQVLGESPAEFSLITGVIIIRAEREGYQSVEREVVIKPGQRVTLTLALPPYRS